MKRLLCCFLAGSCLLCYGQKRNLKPRIVYKKSISFSPFALVAVDGTMSIGGEYRVKENKALLLDAGYIFYSYYLANNEKASGFTFRPAFRYYYGKRIQSYWQAQLLYKQVMYRQNDWLGKDCVNEVPSYYQFQKFKYRKQVAGLNVMAGEVMRLSDRFFLDVYAGLGIRMKLHKVIDVDYSCYRTNSGDVPDIYKPKMVTISVPVNLKIIFKLE